MTEHKDNASNLLAASGQITQMKQAARATLVDAGLDVLRAERLVESAIAVASLAGREPEERIARARAALDTTVALHTADFGDMADHILDLPVSLARLAHDADRTIQIRVGGVDPMVMALYAQAMEAGDIFPPVVCFWDAETDKLQLADGFHRVRAALSLTPVPVTITAQVYAGTRDDALDYAATCNASHGLQLTSEDKRAAITRLLHLHPQLSSRELGRMVGCSHHTAETVRTELAAASGQIAQIERTATRGGTEYTYRPREEPEYATTTQLINCLNGYLHMRLGTRGRRDQTEGDLLAGLALINDMIADSYRAPAGMRLPDHYRKQDLRAAVRQIRTMFLARIETLREAADKTSPPQPAEAPAEPVPVSEPSPVPTADVSRSRPAAAATEPPSLAQETVPPLRPLVPSTAMQHLLKEGDWQEVRRAALTISINQLTVCLRTIFIHWAPASVDSVVRTLIDAIIQPRPSHNIQPDDSAKPDPPIQPLGHL